MSPASLICRGISCSRIFGTQEIWDMFWQWEITGHSFFAWCCGWAVRGVLALQCQGHQARAELQTANMTFGIQSVHLTNGPWKQVLEPYGKQLELTSRLPAFANVKKEERRDEVTCLGNFPVWFSPSTLCQKLILWWSSATGNMCHFVFGKAEATKWSYFYLCHFIYTRTAFIKHGLRLHLISPQFYFDLHMILRENDTTLESKWLKRSRCCLSVRRCLRATLLLVAIIVIATPRFL